MCLFLRLVIEWIGEFLLIISVMVVGLKCQVFIVLSGVLVVQMKRNGMLLVKFMFRVLVLSVLSIGVLEGNVDIFSLYGRLLSLLDVCRVVQWLFFILFRCRLMRLVVLVVLVSRVVVSRLVSIYRGCFMGNFQVVLYGVGVIWVICFVGVVVDKVRVENCGRYVLKIQCCFFCCVLDVIFLWCVDMFVKYVVVVLLQWIVLVEVVVVVQFQGFFDYC